MKPLNRTITQWRNCDPKTIAACQSETAIMYAFQDARADILRMHKALQSLMPANWRDDPDWVAAAMVFDLTPNA